MIQATYLSFPIFLKRFCSLYLLQEPRGKTGSSTLKRKEFDSDGESPPRKMTSVNRRKAIVFDSDED